MLDINLVFIVSALGKIDNSEGIEMKFEEKEKKFDPEKSIKVNQIQQKFKSEKRATKNVFGENLEPCSNDPLTGWLRECCNTDKNDHGLHTVCAS